MDLMPCLHQAMERTRMMLFEPFNLGTWVQLAIMVFLASLTGGGGSLNMNFNMGGRGPDTGIVEQDVTPDFEAITGQAQEFAGEYAAFIALGVVLVLALLVLLIWLSARGEMMYVRATAIGSPSFGDDWRNTRRTGNSLFRFRLVLGLLTLGIVLILGGIFVALGFAISADEASFAWLAFLIPAVVCVGLVGLAYMIVHVLLWAFVVPLMYRLDLLCTEAWSVAIPILKANVLPIVLLIALRMVAYIALSIVSFFVGCLTCCIGFLPVIYQTIFQPFFLFDRHVPLFMLESIGPEFEIFYRPEPPEHQQEPPGLTEQ